MAETRRIGVDLQLSGRMSGKAVPYRSTTEKRPRRGNEVPSITLIFLQSTKGQMRD
jgi:hypothetical protein